MTHGADKPFEFEGWYWGGGNRLYFRGKNNNAFVVCTPHKKYEYIIVEHSADPTLVKRIAGYLPKEYLT